MNSLEWLCKIATEVSRMFTDMRSRFARQPIPTHEMLVGASGR